MRLELRASLPLWLGSYTSIKLNTKTAVPDRSDQELYILMEDDAVPIPGGMRFFLPRQTEWYLIR